MTTPNSSNTGDDGEGGNDGEDVYHCDRCDEAVTPGEAIRTKTFADLDPDTWQVLCCPTCGDRLKTVFVGTGGEDPDDPRDPPTG